MNIISKVAILSIAIVLVFGMGYYSYNILNRSEPDIMDDVEEIIETPEAIEEESGENIKTQDSTNTEIVDENPTLYGTVVGKISDNLGNPINEALIEIGEHSTTTNVNGSYIILIPEGTYYIQASKEGCSQGIEQVQILSNITFEISFSLRILSSGTGEGKIVGVLTHRGSDEIFSIEELFLESDFAVENNIVNVLWSLSPPYLWNTTLQRSSEIDVIWGGNVTVFENMFESGQIVPLDSPQLIETLDDVSEQIDGTDIRGIVNGNVYWVVINDEPIGLLSTANSPQLSMGFIEWMVKLTYLDD